MFIYAYVVTSTPATPKYEVRFVVAPNAYADTRTRIAITAELAKFLTIASAYLYTSVTARPWNA